MLQLVRRIGRSKMAQRKIGIIRTPFLMIVLIRSLRMTKTTPLLEKDEMDDKMDEEMESVTNEISVTHLNEDIDMPGTGHNPKTERLLPQGNQQ
jgi:hypothetical protein